MNNIPKIRFKEFEGEWEEKRLGEMLEFKNGINAPKEKYGRGIKFINVLDILDNNYIMHDDIIGSVDISNDRLKDNMVNYGDIVFQRSSETRAEVGTANVYLDTKPATFGGFVIRGKQISQYNPSFMNYLLKTSKSRQEIINKAGGSTRYNVSQSVLSEAKIITTTLAEQEKIAEFLSNIDSLIENQEKKIENMQETKRGLIQKIFSQELRFKDEKGEGYPEWIEERLENVGRIYQPKTISISKLKGGDYRVFGANGYVGYHNEFNHENEQVSISCRGENSGSVNYTEAKTWITGNSMVINLDDDNSINKLFLYYMLKSQDLRSLVTGSGQPQITRDNLYTHEIKIASLDEQKKIADFLLTIDEKIEVEKEILATLKEIKKGLLQQMFV